jgi:hypothetical protein
MLMTLLHWLNVEYWGVSWPNIFAPSVWTVLAIVIAHIHLLKRQDKHHKAQLHAISQLNQNQETK